MTTPAFRTQVAGSLEAFAAMVAPEARQRIVASLRYMRTDLDDPASLADALAGGPVIAYLALPPWAFAPALRHLLAAGMDRDSRIVIEKPFGESGVAARALNALARSLVDEQNIFRVDHFLHHQTMRNILDWRFAAGDLEDMWNADDVERVTITWDERAGIAGRAGFYDRTGALRDMIQSHLLTLLAVVAMDRPDPTGDDAMRAQRVAALRAIPSLTREQVRTRTVRGRYTAGQLQGLPAGDYAGEDGVDPGRGTETFASVRFSVELPGRSGVPFVLRTGKALARDRRSIEIQFRRPTSAAVRKSSLRPVTVRFQMAPDRTEIDLGDGRGFRDATVASPTVWDGLPASARLIDAVFHGDQTSFLQADEPEEAWRIVEPILDAWGSGVGPLLEYRAGSDGPRDADP
ncbi:MAG: glucose-6-phosphate 1-dehydrogenase [Chloroflexota bacterium]|nr:glucose-6-phosphate 1-dehydrogenase [Chloroflexota bacterium]